MPETRLTRTNRPYTLLSYDTHWKELFDDLKPKLELVFSDNLIAVEHIGSTAIPGMVAKPQVDILIVVKNIDRVKNVYEAMKDLGFAARGDYIGQHEESFIYTDTQGHRLYGIHVMQSTNPNATMYIIFRDYLRHNEAARDEYVATKKELLAKFGANDYNAYDFGKEALLTRLKSEAVAWHNSLKN